MPGLKSGINATLNRLTDKQRSNLTVNKKQEKATGVHYKDVREKIKYDLDIKRRLHFLKNSDSLQSPFNNPPNLTH